MDIRIDLMKQCYLGFEIDGWIVSNDDTKRRNVQNKCGFACQDFTCASIYRVIRTPNKYQTINIADDDLLLT